MYLVKVTGPKLKLEHKKASAELALGAVASATKMGLSVEVTKQGKQVSVASLRKEARRAQGT